MLLCGQQVHLRAANASLSAVLLQVNGKLRTTLELPKDVTKEAAVAAAQKQPSVAKFLDGKQVVKIIFVPCKILNLVVQ